uniref:Peptidase S1 domain-containing protein n=1 Tax=Glossina austeni TaxID=7395 RepID=A0A1A9V6D4_GLOAU
MEPGVYYHVKRIHTHCGYNEPLLHNDIALLHLHSAIVMDGKTETIPLPVQPMDDDDDVLLTGWRGISNSGGGGPGMLKKINLKYVPYERCKDLLDNDPRLDIGNICTLTRKGGGACFGDSGGPLVSKGHLVGVVSWANPCALGFPDAHASAYFYLDWIHQTMQRNQNSELLDNDPRLHVGNICTFTQKGEGACFGDSGGPLVGNGSVVGVVSFANPCALGFPDAYASPYFYLDWIRQTMQGNNESPCNA